MEERKRSRRARSQDPESAAGSSSQEQTESAQTESETDNRDETSTGKRTASGGTAGRTRTGQERRRTSSRQAAGSGSRRTGSSQTGSSGRRRVSSSQTGSSDQTGSRRRTGSRQRSGAKGTGVSRADSERSNSSGARSSGRSGRRKKQTKRRRVRNVILEILLFIIVVVAGVVGAFLWNRYSPSTEQADLEDYYGIEQEGQLAITINDEVVPPEGMISEGTAYVQYDIVRDYINSRFYWDPNENILLYTLPEDTVSVEVGSQDYTVSRDKQSKDYVILKTEGSTAYIALDFVQQYTDMDYEVYNDEVPHVAIVTEFEDQDVATVKNDTQIRLRGGVKSPVLTEVSAGEDVTIIEQEENWSKVRSANGFIGYIQKSDLKDERRETYARDFEEPVYTNISKDYIINMVWHNVTNETANSTVLERIADTKGLTTIAPTWYHVADTDGNLESISSATYVNYCHQSNIEVWATVRDFDGGISSQDESYEFLSYTSKREKFINALIADALQVGVDGINVDFEKISTECGEHFIQFIRELSVRCRQNGLVLSVDNYVPKGYNTQYDRKEQGIVADYVVIMGYDEHYAGSEEAGSVSSYDWVRDGIEETLKEVPADKIISGIPFFTRLWKETPKGADTGEETGEEGEAAEEGGGNWESDEAEAADDTIDANAEEAAESDESAESSEAAVSTIEVSSEAMGMDTAAATVAEAGAEITWDDVAKQDYATWTEGDTTYKIWLENANSIEPKLQLMKDNNLAGSSAWALGQENSDIWQLIVQYVN